jgi:uncharacterized protein (TIGR03083 family)
MRGDDVRSAASEADHFLRPLTGWDWSREIPGLAFTVASVVAHAAGGPLWYAVDLVNGPADDAAFDLRVKPDAGPAALLASLRTAATLCAIAVDQLPSTARGYHPAGSADPSGFAAMACDEILVHTYDAGTGLGEKFMPDQELASLVLARLFPWRQPDPDPWSALLSANGRIDLPGRSRTPNWRWHCAPLAEWDGQIPAWPPSP